MDGHMLQSILSLMLAAVQVLAWNAAPVFLCLEADGTACVDRGPAFCDCCHAGKPSEKGHACGDAGCAGHEHDGLATDERSLGETPCGCEHEQISDAQAAVRGHDRSNFELAARVPAAAILSDVAIAMSSSKFAVDSYCEIGSLSALAARAGVVLRI